MSAYSGKERRRYQRLHVDFTVIYRVDKPLEVRMMIGAKEIYALMLDLSEGGMAISTDHNIPLRTILALKFTLINLHAEGEGRAKSMNITGEVCNSIMLERNEYRLGVNFTRIREEDKDAIAEFIKIARNA